jgi:glucose/arabinose dehydrogenase
VLAQDLRTTYGKVLKITLDGAAAPGNPFIGQADADPRIFSYGHRNPQGADLHPGTGDLWTMEHGPRGGDELNRIEAGENYGWPIVSYGENYSGAPVGTGRTSAPGVTEPRYYWDPVIAPGGFAFYDGDLFEWEGDVIASSLNPGGIVRLKLDGNTVTGEARYLPDLGRVRDIEIDRDGAILVVNDDGNLLRITPR